MFAAGAAQQNIRLKNTMPKILLRTVTLFLMAPLVCFAASPCTEAYNNGKDTENLQRCRTEAEAGNAEAELGYALILWSGHNQRNDQREALTWFQKSARQGNKLAQVALGTFLSHEKVNPEYRNQPEAYAWYITAGETEAANRILLQLSTSDTAKAKKLAKEYEAKFKK